MVKNQNLTYRGQILVEDAATIVVKKTINSELGETVETLGDTRKINSAVAAPS